MGNMIKLRASVTSYAGNSETNNDNFYMNGRFMYEHETDNIQVSIENSNEFYVFAVSDSLDVSDPQKEIFISIARELKRCHEKELLNEGDLSDKSQKLCQCIQEMYNLLTSVSIDKPEDASKKASFTGILLQENKAVIVSIGSGRAYLLRDGNLKLLTVDVEKTERLLRLGIITQEQVKILSSRYGIPTEESVYQIRKSEEFNIKEGDTILLCTDGIANSVDNETIKEILLSGKNTDEIANKLVKEAINNGSQDNMTALAIRIDKILGELNIITPQKKPAKSIKYGYRSINNKKVPKVSININRIKRYASAFVFCLLVAALIFSTVKLFATIFGKQKPNYDKGTWNISDNTNVGSDTTDGQTDGQNQDEDNGETADLPDGSNGGNKASSGENSGGSSQNGTGSQSGKIQFPTTYVVKRGDTLYSISKTFYNDPNKYDIIIKANNIEDPSKIQVGQVLLIPDPNEENSRE